MAATVPVIQPSICFAMSASVKHEERLVPCAFSGALGLCMLRQRCVGSMPIAPTAGRVSLQSPSPLHDVALLAFGEDHAYSVRAPLLHRRPYPLLRIDLPA